MKNECRKGIRQVAALLAMMLLMVSLLAACATDGVKSHYELDVVDHTSDFYVNDFAGVFSEEQKKELMEKAVGFDEESSGIQVVITTVESLDSAVLGYEYVKEDAEGNRIENTDQPSSTPKFTIEQVSYSMYSEYGIGKDDMGILILFSTGDREVRIETGRQMQFYITDSISGRLLDDYGMDYFREDKFAEGLLAVQDATIAKIKSEVPSDWHASSNASENQEDSENSTNATTGVVADGTNENANENVAVDKTTDKKDPANGILWGLFGSIAAAFAAIAAFIRQRFKGKSEKEKLEKAKEEEVETLKQNFQMQLEQAGESHAQKVASLERTHQQSMRAKDDQIRGLNGDLQRANSQISTLTTQLEDMTDKYTRAQQLHPEYNFDEEIHEMIENEYRAAAQKVDEKLTEVLSITATKDNEDVFKDALRLLDGTDHEVRKYVTASRDNIQSLYNKAVDLRQEFERLEQERRDKEAANKAYQSIKRTFDNNPKGNHKSYEDLHAALAIFLGLSAAQRAFFPDSGLIESLKRVHRSAEADYNDYNAAKDAESAVEGIIGSIYSADEDDRDRLARAMRYYRNLTTAQQAYFSEELLRKLKKLISDADEDHTRQERRRDDERRRRQQQMRSSSSFSSSHRSSFGGHGGRPSGGGASRRF